MSVITLLILTIRKTTEIMLHDHYILEKNQDDDDIDECILKNPPTHCKNNSNY